jgi:hypothetical protein
MRQNPTDDELLRSYLLGTLSEQEAEHLEHRLLADDELFELSEAIEADLLAAFDRGELAPEERERVLRRLASSPQGRERFALARALNAAAEAPAPVLTFPRPPAPSRPVFHWVALAAGLLLATGLSWYVVERRHDREAPPSIVVERSAPAHPVAPKAPAPPPALPQVARENRPPAERPQPVKVVCQLALMTLRGSESTQRLSLPPGAETVELQIGVEGMEDLKSFNIVLRSPRGETLLDERGIKPKRLAGVRTLVVELPAGRLSAGKYEIEAQGAAHGGEPEDLSPISVEVVRGSKG